MNITAVTNRMKDIRDEMSRLAEKDELRTEDEQYWAELRTEFDDLNEERKRLEREADLNRIVKTATNPGNVVRGSQTPADDPFGEPESVEDQRSAFGNPWDLSEVRTFGRSTSQVGSELRARALSAIEKAPGASDSVREAMANIIETADTDGGKLARQLLVSASPAYMRAFVKAVSNRSHEMTEDEKRAMSLTDANGGFLVPFQLDPSVIITADGSLNQIRQVARQVIATGDQWNGVSSGSVSWSWDAEAAEASDDATTFAQPSINIHKAVGFVPISLEALQDEQNVTSEVARLLAFGKDELEAAAFATGSGTGQPTGIVTALTGTASELSSAATDTFAVGDVYALDDDLPARYRGRASWLANRAIYNDVRQFDTQGGASLWERLGNDVPANLLGRPVYESEDMDGTITALADNRVLVYGDFSNYVIADRIGMTVELIPHLFATANNRPSGQRGWFAHYRVGADSVNDGAFRMLNVT